MYLVTNQNQAKQVEATNKAGGTTQVSAVSSALELPSYNVRQEIGVAAVNRSNQPAGTDTKGKFHEEGGIVITAQNGQLAVPAQPGLVQSPTSGNPATLNVFNMSTANAQVVAQATSADAVTTYHIHPAGEVTTSSGNRETTSLFIQPPSQADRNLAGQVPATLGYHIVVGAGRTEIAGQRAGGQTVYFYNASGTIGTMPLNRFTSIP